MKVLSVIIPIFNEEKTIQQIVQKVIDQPLVGWKKEIIVVDDGSTDKSSTILQPFLKKITLIQNTRNFGRGYAVRVGIKAATGNAIIFQDGDLEYHPTDWPRLISRLENNNTVIYGTRMHAKNKTKYVSYYLGNRLITKIANMLFSSKLTDMYTGYKLFDSKLIQSISLYSSGFELEAEITACLLKKNIDIIEVPITYKPRSFEEGKKIFYSDGLIGLWTLIKYKYFSA